MKKKLIAIIMALALVLTLTPMAFAEGLDAGESDGSISTSTRQLIEINGKTTDATMGKDGTVTLKVTLPTAEELKSANLSEDALNGVGSITIGLGFDKENLELTNVSVAEPKDITATDNTGKVTVASNVLNEDGETFVETAANTDGIITVNATSNGAGQGENLLNLAGVTVINATFQIISDKKANITEGSTTFDFEFTSYVDSKSGGTSKGFEIASSESKMAAGGDGAEATTQQTTYLATLVGDENTPALFEVATSNSVKVVAGVNITGKVASYNPNNATTISLYEQNAAEDAEPVTSATIQATTGSGQQTQDFKLSGVAAGTYDLVVTKDCHLDYTIKGVTVGTEEIDLTDEAYNGKAYQTITLLAGNVNGDKFINVSDLNIVWNDVNFDKSTTGENKAENGLADIDGNGFVNVTDLNIVWNDANFDKGVENCTFDFE